MKDYLKTLITTRMATDKDIEDRIDGALNLALSAFNAVPEFSYVKWEDKENIMQLSDLLVSYAVYVLLSYKLTKPIPKTYSDNGVEVEINVVDNGLVQSIWENWQRQVSNLKQSESWRDQFEE